MAKKKPSTNEPRLPEVGPLIEGILEVATQSVQRNGEQALSIWKQVTNGDYEPKLLMRDTAIFWSATAKDAAKTFNLFRSFIEKIGDEDRAAAAK